MKTRLISFEIGQFYNKNARFLDRRGKFHLVVLDLNIKMAFLFWKIAIFMIFEWKWLGWVLICSWIRILWSPGGAGEQ